MNALLDKIKGQDKVLVSIQTSTKKSEEVLGKILALQEKEAKKKEKDRKDLASRLKREQQTKKRSSADRQRGSKLREKLTSGKKEKKKGLLESLFGGLGGLGGLIGGAGLLKALGLGAIGAAIAGYIGSEKFRKFVNEKIFEPAWGVIKEGLIGEKGLFGEENRKKVWEWMKENPLKTLGGAAAALGLIIGPRGALYLGLKGLGLVLGGLKSTIIGLGTKMAAIAGMKIPAALGLATGTTVGGAAAGLAAAAAAPIALAAAGGLVANEAIKGRYGGGEAGDIGLSLYQEELKLNASKKNKRGRQVKDFTKEEIRRKKEIAEIRKELVKIKKERDEAISDATETIPRSRGRKRVNQTKVDLANKEYEEKLIQIKAKYKLQKGGPIRVPGTGSGDTVPALLPPGSFVLNRNATNAFFQDGGRVPAMLEPQEMVFPKASPVLEMMNNAVPRFQEGGFVYPLPKGHTGTGPSQVFGAPRSGGRKHAGVDLVETPPWGADPKLSVVAPKDGVVSSEKYTPGGYVAGLILNQNDGHDTRFVHMKPEVPVGTKVKAGDTIGRLIDLNNNSHLHFELYKSGSSNALDPTPYLKNAGKISGSGMTIPGMEEAPDGKKGEETGPTNSEASPSDTPSTPKLDILGSFMKGLRKGLGKYSGLADFFFGSAGKSDTSVNPNDNLKPAKIDDSEMGLFKRLVVAEAGGEGLLGQALVARSVMNRLSLIQSGNATTGTFMANDETLKGVILGSGQYQPVSDGSINKEFSSAQIEQAGKAIEMAKNVADLRGRLEAAGKDAKAITYLVNSTGFRTGSAFNDESQNVNTTQFKNHFFNTAGNSVMKYQKGGLVGAKLEAGEGVFLPHMMNEAVPRFQAGGSIKSISGTTGEITSAFREAGKKRLAQKEVNNIIVINSGGGRQRPMVMPQIGEPGASTTVPSLPSGPSDGVNSVIRQIRMHAIG